jgi:hypothetical protein
MRHTFYSTLTDTELLAEARFCNQKRSDVLVDELIDRIEAAIARGSEDVTVLHARADVLKALNEAQALKILDLESQIEMLS